MSATTWLSGNNGAVEAETHRAAIPSEVVCVLTFVP